MERVGWWTSHDRNLGVEPSADERSTWRSHISSHSVQVELEYHRVPSEIHLKQVGLGVPGIYIYKVYLFTLPQANSSPLKKKRTVGSDDFPFFKAYFSGTTNKFWRGHVLSRLRSPLPKSRDVWPPVRVVV